MARTYKCPFDKKSFKKIPELEKYVEKNYIDKIPKQYNKNVSRFLYDFRNGPGKCQICGAPTEWNEKKKRYKILCEPLSWSRLLKDPFRVIKTFLKNKGNSCFEVVAKRAQENMMRAYGSKHLMNDIDHQQKLMASRKIAKVINFKGVEYTVLGSYEELFVKVCSPLLFAPNDLESPGPVSPWKDEDGTTRQHFTDFFLPKYNLVVSIKDGGDNKNNHPSMVERRKKDAMKFKSIIENTEYNAVELNGTEQINDFPRILKEIKNSKDRYIIYPDYYYDYFDK